MSRPKQRTPQSLLALLDGGYQRNNECECPSKEHIRSTKITYSKFRLTPVCCKPYCLCCGVVLTLLVIALVVISVCESLFKSNICFIIKFSFTASTWRFDSCWHYCLVVCCMRILLVCQCWLVLLCF